MASVFWEGEKAEKEEARKALMEFIEDNWTGRFTANFSSDDGGYHIQAVLEVDNPDKQLADDIGSKFGAKWMGWRLIILKVAPGYIDAFLS